MAFDRDNPSMTNAEISSRIGVSRAAVRRTLITLVDLGYMVKTSRNYRLTPKILDLGFSFLSSLNLDERIQISLDRISNEVNESCALGVLDNTDIRYLVTSNPRQRKVPLMLSVGNKIPSLNTAMGKVYLSQMDNDEIKRIISESKPLSRLDEDRLQNEFKQIRELGYVVTEGSYEKGINGIAVPVFKEKGKVVAALGIIANGIRAPREVLIGEFLPVLKNSSKEVGQALF